MIKLLNAFVVVALLLVSTDATAKEVVTKSHSMSLIDSHKYEAGFTHFEYANPNAPKGGTFKRAMFGTFDSFNQFAPKGMSYQGLIYGNIYDSLMVSAYDEALTMYGLLAESVEYPEDNSWVIFNINKKAKWHDGKSITAEDVEYSFEKIIEVNPILKDYYKLVEKVEVLGTHRVKFTFNKEELSKELPFLVGQLTIIPKHYWETRDLSKSTLEPPLGSGPYKMKSFEAGKNIILERVDNYWGADVPVNKGHYNFDTLIYEYFRDSTVAFEAFKTGHYDFTAESAGARWQKGYTGKYFDMGLIKKEEIPHSNSQGMMGFAFNTSVKPFDNPLVRKAINYAYDFEWVNKNIYYDMEQRYDSYFTNTEMAVPSVPSIETQALIKELKPNATATDLTEPLILPKSDGTGNNRANLMEAVKLLEQAGYSLKNGKMVDKDGKPLQLEIITSSKVIESELLNFQKALQRIGIDFYIRYMDSSQYVKRVRDRDYMMIYIAFRQSDSPGNEQRGMWHSTAAAESGSRNYAMISDPAIDKAVEKIVTAKNRPELIAYTKVLDRLLQIGWYIIPAGYTDRYRIAYWDKFDKPAKKADRGIVLSTWWSVPEKAKKIETELKK